MKKLSVILCTIVLVLGFVGTSSAFLYDRGGGLIYDSDQNITWLQDANYAQTSGYDADGLMTWNQATAWASQLVYGGYDDWRLPTTVDGPYVYGYDGTTTGGYNIISSEMGYMFYINLGNFGYINTNGIWPQGGWGLKKTGPFNNLQSDYDPWNGTSDYYWSGTEYSANPGYAWLFGFAYGNQFQAGKSRNCYAWAVLDGDVAPIPIPSAVWLFGSGLIWIVGVRNKFRKR